MLESLDEFLIYNARNWKIPAGFSGWISAKNPENIPVTIFNGIPRATPKCGRFSEETSGSIHETFSSP